MRVGIHVIELRLELYPGMIGLPFVIAVALGYDLSLSFGRLAGTLLQRVDDRCLNGFALGDEALRQGQRAALFQLAEQQFRGKGLVIDSGHYRSDHLICTPPTEQAAAGDTSAAARIERAAFIVAMRRLFCGLSRRNAREVFGVCPASRYFRTVVFQD